MPTNPNIFPECGGLTNLLKGAGFLMSEGLALTVGFIGALRDSRIPPIARRVAGALTAVAVGVIWTFLAEPYQRKVLAICAILSAFVTLLALILFVRLTDSQMLLLVYVAIAVAGPVALSCTALLSMLPKPIQVRILTPHDNDCRQPEQVVEGTWENLPEDHEIWVTASSADGMRFFPEDHEANRSLNGRWDSSLSHKPRGSEQRFYVRALVVSGEARAKLQAWARDPARIEMAELPKGTLFADRIVMRGPAGCSANAGQ